MRDDWRFEYAEAAARRGERPASGVTKGIFLRDGLIYIHADATAVPAEKVSILTSTAQKQ